jgi:heme-degrading monooxygenase HmoA
MLGSPKYKEDKVMKQSYLSLQRYLLLGALMGVVLLFTVSASAEPVLRIVSFTAAGPDQQKELAKMAPGKLYAEAKGCQWVKFWSDPSTGETGSVSLWDSRADMEAFLNSDAYKAIFPGKVKPLTKGDISVKVYPVFEPK